MAKEKCPNCKYFLVPSTLVVGGPRGSVRIHIRFCPACGFQKTVRTETLEEIIQPADIEWRSRIKEGA